MSVLLAVLAACMLMGLVVITVLLVRVLGSGVLGVSRSRTEADTDPDVKETEPPDGQRTALPNADLQTAQSEATEIIRQAVELREQAERDAAELLRRAEESARAVRERAEAESALRGSLVEAQAREAGRKSAETFRTQAEEEVRVLRAELHERDARLVQREQRLEARATAVDEQVRQIEARDHDLAAREAELARRRAEVVDLEEERRRTLENAARLTAAQARSELVKVVEADARRDAAVLVRDIEAQARERGEERARKIVTLAIQRVASEATTESVVSVLHLPSDEMKGRIIGREGRNIRSFESVTGVNVIIDDTPEAVLLSCFDPVRREIGKITLEALVGDGRIHPHRIEEEHDRARREVEARCLRAGEDALVQTGVAEMHPELIALLGRLRYRTSYGQNVLAHLVESAHLAGIMAAELRLPPALAKRGTLLHDLGKALTHEVEGSHALIGAEIARRYGEDEEVVHAIEAHHNEVEPRSIGAVLTQAADQISGGRPGARRESLESYVKRLERIEQIAAERPGVEKVFAMQAGREVRVMVVPDQVDDIAAHMLARDVAKQIEDELTYPGQIRVTVVRETRAVETAR
ncbi:ribonuclease Y [Protofrankia symbiont of Coriaria ruscifolia]|uniref:ribonuclease Y n=1 Tax=Protofrankia symbiont of Coriaria ruscifolia TaxID=1306542 RepID=UPI00104107A0|nr:ribonuclease Y [Protofrankia symbiont of Coriaria ruscifolia]